MGKKYGKQEVFKSRKVALNQKYMHHQAEVAYPRTGI
jgi:hypothetical protein